MKSAVIVASGLSSRYGSDKLKINILGKTVLERSVDVFRGIADEIIVVGECDIQGVKTVKGGSTRFQSVTNGLNAVSDKCDTVAVHDGARPFISEEILERAYREVCKSRACVVGMPVKDTIKIADEKGCIHMTPNRSLVWQIQTPQVFAEELILPAYREVIEKEKELLEQGIQITDDAMVVENVCGCPVRLVEGSYGNLKITTPEDLEIAKIFAGGAKDD